MILAENVKPRKQAVIYCRVSTDKQEQDGESLEYQEAKCRRYAELHDIDVIAVLHEAKSGFIHYTHREQLTLARQFIRDKLADTIIVWDLRRFSRNFVHSAMIFEEIERHGGEIISVSENIDNSLTGKLIRSILAWSAESEREKIVEYANRRWQTRVELGLPVGTGRALYGWDWADEDKTAYVINPEQAAVRVSIFHMYVELGMSLRAITHKLTEDRVLTPTYAKKFRDTPPVTDAGEVDIQYTLWRFTTVRSILKDLENIGTLVICKDRQVIGPDGKRQRLVHPNRKEVPDGIPGVIDPLTYRRALEKLKSNQADKSRLPLNPDDFLLRGHIFCAVCGWSMKPRTQKKGRLTKQGTDKSYPFYLCTNYQNKYQACPALSAIRTSPLDDIVWQDCCVLFKRINAVRAVLEQEVSAAVSAWLEQTTGREQVDQLEAVIALAKTERTKHAEGSYTYTLISQDIAAKENDLARYREELGSVSVEQAAAHYRARIMGFLDFLNVMHGSYEQATFQQKRNALDVLGVKVVVREYAETYGLPEDAAGIGEDEAWFTAKEAARILGVSPKTIHFYRRNGTITNYKEEPHLLIHTTEVLKLQQKGFLQRNTADIVRQRIEVTYSPRFNLVSEMDMPTGVSVSLQTRRYV